jgi:putative spermidine/putrescine transport system permease protein
MRISARIQEATTGYALIFLPLGLLMLLVLFPTASLLIDTLQNSEGYFSLEHYQAFFSDDYSLANLRYTLFETIVSCVIALIIALCISLYLRFSQGRIAAWVHGLSLFPLFVPSVIISYALIRFLGPNGFLQIILDRLGLVGFHSPYLTATGPIIGFVWENLPLPILVISAGLAQISDHAIEAARDLGASKLRVLFEILLPQIMRALLVAFALIFLGTIGSYTIPYLLGPAAPEMMGPFMRRTYTDLNKPDEAAVQAMIIIFTAAVVGAFYIAAMLRGRAEKT